MRTEGGKKKNPTGAEGSGEAARGQDLSLVIKKRANETSAEKKKKKSLPAWWESSHQQRVNANAMETD